MDEVQADGPRVRHAAEESAASDSGGFWRSLPGVLTASGTFLAGLAGLAAVIVPNLSNRPSAGNAAPPSAQAPGQAAAATSPASAAAAGASAVPAPAATPPADPAPPVVRAPSAAPQPVDPQPTASDRFVAAFASDGFVVLRSHPTTDGAEVTRILVGGAVRCGAPRWVADGYRWRRCVDQDGRVGFMSDTFLRKA